MRRTERLGWGSAPQLPQGVFVADRCGLLLIVGGEAGPLQEATVNPTGP